MKKLHLLLLATLIAFAMTSCGSGEEGPTEKILSKKIYAKMYAEYDYLSDEFVEGLCEVEKKHKYGFIDSKGKEVIPCIYQKVYDCSDGMIRYKENNLYGFLNKKGKVVVPPTYKDAECFTEGLAVVVQLKEGSKWKKNYGFIDKKGDVKIPLTFDHAKPFSDGLACVEIKDMYGYIDKNGEISVSPIYDEADPFSEGIAMVRKGREEMAIDTKGEVIYTLSQRLYVDSEYHEGLLRVADNNDYVGFVDKKGELVIKCKYEDADDFENGISYVEIDDDVFCINKKGEKVDTPKN